MNVVVMMFVDIKSVDFDGILWELVEFENRVCVRL